MPFWKRKMPEAKTHATNLSAGDIVSEVSTVYADYNTRRQLVKPRSSLPCSWFAARECFMIAYDGEYRALPKDLHNSYQYVYGELAFFVEDELCEGFNHSLNIAANCRSKRLQAIGLQEDEAFCKQFIASVTVKIEDREQIWAHLSHEDTCPKAHLVLIAETLVYCGALYRAMYDEWVAFANLLAFQKKPQEHT